MNWDNFIKFGGIVGTITAAVTPVVLYLYSRFNKYTTKLVDHDRRISVVETLVQGVKEDVRDIKAETRNQTTLLIDIATKVGK
jgi:hypothetical protein